MIWPKISVVTPSFNQVVFIEQTLLSVLQQDYPNLEYIVIDGGSTDGAREIIERYATQLTYWVSEPDRGHTEALQKGFARATGEIMCWLNSDDLLQQGALREVAEYFQVHRDVQAIYGDALWIDRNCAPLRLKKEHGFNRFIWFYDYNYIPQPSLFWRRDLYEKVGGIETHFALAMDTALIARFATVTNPQHVPRVWSRIRRYPEQRNQRLRAQSNREDQEIRERYCGAESRMSYQVKHVLAKTLRVACKLVKGCYW